MKSYKYYNIIRYKNKINSKDSIDFLALITNG